MGMSLALVVNIALDLLAFSGVIALAAWAIKTGAHQPSVQSSQPGDWRDDRFDEESAAAA